MVFNINPFTLVKVLLVVAMLCFGLYQIFITNDKKFEEVEASLLEAHSETYNSYSQGSHKTRTNYYFKYQYTFNGKDYTSERYAHVSPNPALGVERFKGVKEGTTITVFVHPSIPSYAVVQKGPPFLFIYTLVLTGLLGLLNCFFEWWLGRLLNGKLVKDKKPIENSRKYFKITGASTAIGIFLSTLFFFFAI